MHDSHTITAGFGPNRRIFRRRELARRRRLVLAVLVGVGVVAWAVFGSTGTGL